MTDRLLTEASRQLFRRQADDRFADLSSLVRAARERRHASREFAEVPPSALIFRARENDSEHPIRLTVDHSTTRELPELRLSHYALTQLCGTARAPQELLQRLPPRTIARVLNESIRSPRCSLSDRALLVNSDTSTLRALTSNRYARVWDDDVFSQVDRWLAPVGFSPAVPTFNFSGDRPRDIFGDDRPALWSGDRDSFAFFYSEPDPGSQDFGGLRRGVYVGNSEVGAAALHFSTFLFRDMCANFLIWGASQVKRRKARHVGDSARIFRVYCRELQRLATESQPANLDVIGKAARTAFVGNGTLDDETVAKAIDRLAKEFSVTRGLAQRAVDSAALPQNAAQTGDPALSHWTIASGLTWAARDTDHAADLVTVGAVAERIIVRGAR